MSSTKDEKDMSNRREFFYGVASSMAGATMLAAAAQLGVPILNAAQGGEAKPKEAVSTFFRNPPPWPKGTDGHIYDHLYSTKLKENSLLPDIIPGPQAYFRGNSDLPGAKINMGWQIFTKPIKLEMESHHHSVDEYQFYLGSTFPDLVGSFDAEIEVFIGPKYERHIINEATVLYLPAGLEHNPCDFRKVGKPVFFSSLHMAPFCNGVYQTMGYRTFVSARKID